MRTSEKTRKPGHANRFDSHAECAFASIALFERRLKAIESHREIKTGRWLELMEPPLERSTRSLQKNVTPGSRQRIRETRDFGIIQRLGTCNPEDRRTVS